MVEVVDNKQNRDVERDYGTNCRDCERYLRVGEVCVIEHGKRFLWEYCRDFEAKVELPDYNELMKTVRQEHATQRQKEREKREREKKLKLKERQAKKEQKRRDRIARSRRKYFANLKKKKAAAEKRKREREAKKKQKEAELAKSQSDSKRVQESEAPIAESGETIRKAESKTNPIEINVEAGIASENNETNRKKSRSRGAGKQATKLLSELKKSS